ncbi:MAG: hemerythrin domain-containing protein [Alphaproteobacteria bacterium]|nr:hemerythrin domain-containing protein [Alphaproteobacteria bacterium]
MDITKFLHQHEEALELLDKLESDCSKEPINSRDLSESLVSIAAKLKFHLAMEDKFLYPKAATSSDQDLKNLSQKMSDEMGKISIVFEAYVNRWSRIAIEREPQKFLTETAGIIDAIRKRIEREESSLYPLAEQKL